MILSSESSAMPPELHELYSLYQMEVQYSNQDRDAKYINELNGHMLRVSLSLFIHLYLYRY